MPEPKKTGPPLDVVSIHYTLLESLVPVAPGLPSPIGHGIANVACEVVHRNGTVTQTMQIHVAGPIPVQAAKALVAEYNRLIS